MTLPTPRHVLESNRTIKRFVWGMILTVGVVFGYVVVSNLRFRPDREVSIDYRKNYPLLTEQIQQANAVVLYEGLPHQIFEKDLLGKELQSKDTIKIHDFPFYREKLVLTAEDARELTSLVCDGKTLKPDSAYVSMGYRISNPDGSITYHSRVLSFHPDYTIQWIVQSKKYTMHVCFGCCMVYLFGPECDLSCDLDSSNDGPLGKVLKKYRKNRPKR